MESVTKPDRPPDYVTSYGSAYWWPEMIRMDGMGGYQRIVVNQETGELGIPDKEGKFGKAFSRNISEQYNNWWYETFERHLVEDKDD